VYQEKDADDLKMFKTGIRKVGTSFVVTLTAEMFEALDAKEGDTVYVTHSDGNGIKLQLHDPELLAALKAAEDVMDENRALLKALA